MKRDKIEFLISYRKNLWKMALSQIKVKYSNAALGLLWALVDPLLVLVAVSFVFTKVIKIDIVNFPLFALCGIFPWSFLSNSIFEATTSIIDRRSILHQFNIPRELIPLSAVLANFLIFLIGWCIIYPVFVFFNFKILFLFPFLILVVLLNFIFVCGLGLILSVANVFFRDTIHFLRIFFMFWFWITPIFYSLNMVPEYLIWILRINPAASFVFFYRNILFGAQFPSTHLLVAVFLWSMFSFFAGFVLFSMCESRLLKRL